MQASTPTGSVDKVVDDAKEIIVKVRPRWRGWLHLATVLPTLAAGAVLLVLSPTASTRVGSGCFVLSALALFGISAAYHRGTWPARAQQRLRRLDHASIFVLIAGSCTAYSLLLLRGEQQIVLLVLIWSGAFAGVVLAVCWINSPRWLHTPPYIALGGAALLFTPGFVSGALQLGPGIGLATLFFLVAGGVLYAAGGVVYGFQRPDPWPRTFGFHEVFHSLTVLAFASHYVGIFLATLAAR